MAITTRGRQLPDFPMFKLYSIDQLLQLLPYSEIYLRDLKMGRQKLRPRFKQVAASALRMSEEQLFGNSEAETPEA